MPSTATYIGIDPALILTIPTFPLPSLVPSTGIWLKSTVMLIGTTPPPNAADCTVPDVGEVILSQGVSDNTERVKGIGSGDPWLNMYAVIGITSGSPAMRSTRNDCCV